MIKRKLLGEGKEIIAYEYEDVFFANTAEFLKTRKNYERYGTYCLAPQGTADFTHFWDTEEERIKNGMTIPGKLITKPDGSWDMQDVHITGEHYAYMNYGRILMTVDSEDALLGKGTEQVLKNRTAQKKVAFPDFWDGDYHYFKALELARSLGLHIVVAKARRKGYSYKNGFKGAIHANMNPNSTTIIGAFDKKYLTQGDATTVMTKNYLDFFEENTDFNRGYISESLENLELGYMPEGTRIKKGYRSKILTVSFKDNPNAAVGKDASLIILEEAGVFPNIMDALGVTIPTMEDGDYITGQLIVFGTGGTKEANWEGFEQLFYDPISYGFMPFVNLWDDEAHETTCGFFHGHTLNLKPYIDKDGNSNHELASTVTKERREAKKAQGGTTEGYYRYVGQRCLKPSEAFGGSKVSVFDSPELRDHITKVEHLAEYKDIRQEGLLYREGEVVKFVTKHNLPEVDQHPFLTKQLGHIKDLHGCYAEWGRPVRLNGKVPEKLYRVWVDPYAFKKEAGEISFNDSLGAAYVYERSHNLNNGNGDRLVASFVGRPPDPDTFNEMVLAMTLRWNAQVQFENDRGDLDGYFKRAGYYNRLEDVPDFDWQRELRGSKGSIRKGITISQGSDRKGDAALLLKKWLYTKKSENGYNGKPLYVFHGIYDIGLLKELQKWNFKGNFDRVSALIIGMLDKQEIYHVDITAANTVDSDDFFRRELF